MSAPRGLPRAPAGARPGDLVVARAWKYDGAAHWVVPGWYLGADRHGDWVFQPRGSLVSRPGHAFLAASDALCLFPRAGDWVATFYDAAHPQGLRVYVDISTGLGWQALRPAGWEASSIDMDLDVVRYAGGGACVEDEDEFAAHAPAKGYPEALVAAMREACAAVHARVAAGEAPFDGIDQLDHPEAPAPPAPPHGPHPARGTAAAWFDAARARTNHPTIPPTAPPTPRETP
ncbi:hypothetical protein NCCP1664_20120 [Zafaria cholistanensis]|uniref:DUF402 domain-containing protein n=1 Tax=Zafaria cholistanensis TaxID=1682741 RepID=A0A5A7NUH9_9MICC|nr:DUF402 domain-containing protein [Zafaria cholistanensis]GER23517.1 hypothetical protein NCCP1664_20120 [Zafaria cholistanensis]